MIAGDVQQCVAPLTAGDLPGGSGGVAGPTRPDLNPAIGALRDSPPPGDHVQTGPGKLSQPRDIPAPAIPLRTAALEWPDE